MKTEREVFQYNEFQILIKKYFARKLQFRSKLEAY